MASRSHSKKGGAVRCIYITPKTGRCGRRTSADTPCAEYCYVHFEHSPSAECIHQRRALSAQKKRGGNIQPATLVSVSHSSSSSSSSSHHVTSLSPREAATWSTSAGSSTSSMRTLPIHVPRSPLPIHVARSPLRTSSPKGLKSPLRTSSPKGLKSPLRTSSPKGLKSPLRTPSSAESKSQLIVARSPRIVAPVSPTLRVAAPSKLPPTARSKRDETYHACPADYCVRVRDPDYKLEPSCERLCHMRYEGVRDAFRALWTAGLNHKMVALGTYMVTAVLTLEPKLAEALQTPEIYFHLNVGTTTARALQIPVGAIDVRSAPASRALVSAILRRLVAKRRTSPHLTVDIEGAAADPDIMAFTWEGRPNVDASAVLDQLAHVYIDFMLEFSDEGKSPLQLFMSDIKPPTVAANQLETATAIALGVPNHQVILKSVVWKDWVKARKINNTLYPPPI